MWGDQPFSLFQVEALASVGTALVTLATLVWAVVVTLRAEKRAEIAERHERLREANRELDASSAQASRVTVYKGRSEPMSEKLRFTFATIKVDNASDQPIFAITVHGTIPDGDTVLEYRSKTRLSVPPRTVNAFGLDGPEFELYVPSEITLVAVTFRDAKEVVWLRTETGRLLRMPENEATAAAWIRMLLDDQWTPEARAELAENLANGSTKGSTE